MENQKEAAQIQAPASKISVTIGPNSYDIKLPNNGQLIDIERWKIQLTSGTHKDMLFGRGPSQQAYLITEVIATLSVLIPDLSKDLNVKSLLELDMIMSKQIIKSYEDTIYPWLQQMINYCNQEVDDKK